MLASSDPAGDELGEFLASRIRTPGRHRLLVTSRYPTPLPRRADRRLTVHQLGPLSWPEARKLMWAFRRWTRSPRAIREPAYAGVGGHPRTFGYLDALLRSGRARFADVSERGGPLAEPGMHPPDAEPVHLDDAIDTPTDVGLLSRIERMSRSANTS
ncbi:hypothetical protein [Streptomyces sp. NPDC055287]